MPAWRKYKISEQNLNWAAQQFYDIYGRYPTRREAAEWFRDWSGKQMFTYSIHPLLLTAVLFGGWALGSAIFVMLGLDSDVLPCISSLGAVALLFIAQVKYESYRWERLIEGRPSPSQPLLETARGGGTRTSQAPCPADWYADPTGRHDHRYWDGSAWTTHVSDGGVQSQDRV